MEQFGGQGRELTTPKPDQIGSKQRPHLDNAPAEADALEELVERQRRDERAHRAREIRGAQRHSDDQRVHHHAQLQHLDSRSQQLDQNQLENLHGISMFLGAGKVCPYAPGR